jgi:fibronectin-binding autotransporter adhesin
VNSFTTNTTVNNEGTISADNVAVFLRGGTLNNAEGATLSGNAAVVSTERNSTIHNSGQLNGVADGVFTDSGVTLINNETGIITATEGTGINVHASAGISNHGTVTGKWTGIYLEDGGTVLNTGDIQANTGDGIVANGRVFVNNESGKISGARFGIAAYAQARVINDTDGEIQGNANESDFGDALYFVTQEVIDNFGLPEQSYDDEVINRGLISGNVTLGAGDDVFVQQGETAQTTGMIDGGQGFDALSVDMQDGETGNIDGDQLANIEKFEKLGAGFLTYSGSADFEEVLIRQGELSMSTGSVINLITSLSNINSGQLTVANGGILSGGGTINGTVNVLDGGIVNPGFSPGTLTIDGDFNLGIGGILQIEVQQLANGDLVFDNYIVNGGFSVLGGAVELLFDLVDTGVTSVADTLADFELSDFFTFSNDADGSIFSSFTDALITNASFFTSSESDNETSQLTFNNGELDFNDVSFSEVQGLPSQFQNTDPENINSPATWSLSLLAIAAMLRLKRGKKLVQLK